MAKSTKRPRSGRDVLRSGAEKRPKTVHSSATISGNGRTKARNPQKQGQTTRKPKIPFGRRDNILLLGEGDFSFSLSLLTQHQCKHLTTTSYDSHESLLEKYPLIQATLDKLQGADTQKSLDDNHETVEVEESTESDGDEWQGFSPPTSDGPESPGETATKTGNIPESSTSNTTTILHGIDACKVGGSKEVRRHGPYDKVVFNFPHVGGITKDVNRQVRLNQELLVGFFKSCKGLLGNPSRPARKSSQNNDVYVTDDEEEDEDGEEASGTSPYGQIILSVFEGEPYTLWNVRDLARHSGYRVVESFRFPWEAYPGYKHARTIGDLHGKERDDGKRSGAWRGEEREARMYIFEVNDASSPGTASAKKKGGNDSDDSE